MMAVALRLEYAGVAHQREKAERRISLTNMENPGVKVTERLGETNDYDATATLCLLQKIFNARWQCYETRIEPPTICIMSPTT